MIIVRDVHKNNHEHRNRLLNNLIMAYENTIQHLSSWSYLMYNRELIVSSSIHPEEEDMVKELWRTYYHRSFFENITTIIRN